ncbi:hypothetical protein M433DRAFT_151555 [Acidomyces richmondensis BFW]|nr:MAG: hypothetical protein FE78DRAFT_85546 [Acidomyces sp. 'richmondensis']KYG48040.1 hypothetical protein M433DRAFT_151555 [Acidomyces richmondensis BFW]
MPSTSSSRPTSRRSAAKHATSTSSASAKIDKLDYHPGGRPLRPRSSSRSLSPAPSLAGSFFSAVASQIAAQHRQQLDIVLLRTAAFLWALISTLAAGSITAYSLYAPLFQQRLRYSQLQVNGVSITAELAMYLPVPLFGLLCDRVGPGPPSLLAGVLFGVGYSLAAFAYRSGPPDAPGGWPYGAMVAAFVPIGCATSCMYISAVTTCAKNFGRGRFRGVALALPIACFGLSGMWESQVASRFLREEAGGEVDVGRFFIFLAGLLTGCGVVGFFALRVVGEEELIEEAVEELEASGLLEPGVGYRPRFDPEREELLGNGGPLQAEMDENEEGVRHYGTLATDDERRLREEEVDDLRRKSEETRLHLLEQERKKNWLLNEETKFFLTDRTMWWLAAGFFLVTGPGEAFINNLGTIIGTLYSPNTSSLLASSTIAAQSRTSAATHVSIVAVTSTLARILTGTLTDLLAPVSPPIQHLRGPHSLQNSLASLPAPSPQQPWYRRHPISRLAFLIAFSLLMSVGQVLLASGALQNHGARFWLVSASIGAGYGAVFSLTPIIVSVVWGVENFGTNWGLVATAPAVGATVWGLVYSGVYQAGAREFTVQHALLPSLGWRFMGRPMYGTDFVGSMKGAHDDIMCYGRACYVPTFWAMAVSVWVACALWTWAWRGPGGWRARGIAV